MNATANRGFYWVQKKQYYKLSERTEIHILSKEYEIIRADIKIQHILPGIWKIIFGAGMSAIPCH